MSTTTPSSTTSGSAGLGWPDPETPGQAAGLGWPPAGDSAAEPGSTGQEAP